MKQVPLSRLALVARQALLTAGAIIKKGFYQKRQVKFKSPTSPVTHIDLQSEKKVISIIRAAFPDHGFLAEESDYLSTLSVNANVGPRRRSQSEFRWLIDPLDGTVNFLHGFPHCCVSIGVERGGKVLAGGIYDPFRNELFMAVRGRGASLNGKKIKVSDKKTVKRSLLMTGFPYDHRERAGYYLKLAKPFLEKSMDLRRLGSAALDLAWLAAGRFEGYWESNLNPWDVAAGWLIVEEAGGRMSDYRGWPIDIDRPTQVLATNGRIHREMLALFRRTPGI